VLRYDRPVTQRQAAALYERHAEVGILAWWSTLEASWRNLTLFDRAAERVAAIECERLGVDDPVVASAAEFLGLRVAG
jgi:hypothetical protein